MMRENGVDEPIVRARAQPCEQMAASLEALDVSAFTKS